MLRATNRPHVLVTPRTPAQRLACVRRLILACGGPHTRLLALALFVAGCKAFGFVPLETTKGTADVFCGMEADRPASIVVAVRVKRAVSDARFVVTSKAPPDAATDWVAKSAERAPVYLPKGVSCIRVPLPPHMNGVSEFEISFSGNAGNDHVTGGLLTCQPAPVRDWPCEVR
jgi:hypothetical protein